MDKAMIAHLLPQSKLKATPLFLANTKDKNPGIIATLVKYFIAKSFIN